MQVLAIGLIAGSPARSSAQDIDPARYAPLTEIGYWEYVLDDTTNYPVSLPAFVSIQVTGDTLVGNVTYAHLQHRKYDDQRRELSQQSCGVQVDSQGRYSMTPFSDDSCTAYVDPIPWAIFKVAKDSSIVVAGVTYDVPGLALSYLAPGGTRNTGTGWTKEYAADVGLYRYTWFEILDFPESGSISYSYRLNYADVRGKMYGTSVVAIEKEELPLRHGEWIQDTFPNPFGGALQVLFNRVPGPEATYSIYDLLGRRLDAGTISSTSTSTTIHVGELPSGVYVLQVEDGQGHFETRRVVRISED